VASEPTIPLVPRQRVRNAAHGSFASARRGAGRELVGARLYRPGDDVRDIDRVASARLSLALDRDELVVREHMAEASTTVVLVEDRRPSMELFPPRLPWLSKPRAVAEVGRLLAASAARVRCPFWRAGHLGLQLDEAQPGFDAPPDALALAFEELARVRLAGGTFVFVVSDFCAAPSEAVWAEALGRGWDLVPVVIQDERWERSFPDVGGVVLPVWDADRRRVRPTRLTRREVRARQRANEERFTAILDRFESFGLDPIVLAGHERETVYERFSAWAEARRPGRRGRP